MHCDSISSNNSLYISSANTSLCAFQQILLENWLIQEATRIEKAALEMALLKEQCAQWPKMEFGERSLKKEPRDVKMEDDENGGTSKEQFLTRCGIAWKFLANMHQNEFEKLRRAHQVSKNRHVGYGVRYACTRNAKARDNCPYLMLCMPNSDGSLRVFYRNAHTHPVRQIRAREVSASMTSSATVTPTLLSPVVISPQYQLPNNHSKSLKL